MFRNIIIFLPLFADKSLSKTINQNESLPDQSDCRQQHPRQPFRENGHTGTNPDNHAHPQLRTHSTHSVTQARFHITNAINVLVNLQLNHPAQTNRIQLVSVDLVNQLRTSWQLTWNT
jgi:hypothetical protein